MQKFPLRNQRNRSADDVSIRGGGNSRSWTTVKRDLSHHKMPPRITAPIRQLSTTKPTAVTISKRVRVRDLDDTPTWNEVLSAGSKSPASSSPVGSNTASASAAIMAATTQEQVQQTSAGVLEVPGNATAADSQHHSSRNKDDDDNNRRSRRQPRITQPGAQPQPTPAASGCASAREFMTFEGLRLRDQINFLPFDPYRTLKFLITELKSRLRTVAPDDINVQRILVDIQQTVKRIRMQNVSEPMLPPPSSRQATTKGAGPTAATEFGAEAESGPMTTTVECILPKERRHVIKKEDPLINHARKVNSFCQTMVPQWSNVNACQMCEHQVKQGAEAREFYQKTINGNSNAEEETVAVNETGPSQHLRDDGEECELKKRLSCKSLQDAIENLKIKSNPFPDDTQEIITHLKTELLNSKRELQRTSSSSLAHRSSSTTENLKVQCKRLLNEDEENAIQEGETFPVPIAKPPTIPPIESNKSDSSTQVTLNNISKESQTNLQSPTRVFCHLEKEKLLLLHRFRASEIQNIQGDLNELHDFIKNQLDGIYHSITREDINLKYHPTGKVPQSSKKNRHNFKRAAGKTSSQGLLPLPCSSSSSVLSSTELPAELRATSPESSILQGHYKISSSTSNAVDDGNANSTESMMKQKQKQKHNHKPKSSSGSQSTAVLANAKATHDNINDVDMATNKALGEKKSKDLSHQHHSHQHCHLVHSCCASIIPDTPFCGAKKNHHFSAVECENLCPHSVQRNMMMMAAADAARTSAHNEIKPTTKTFPTAMTYHYKHCQQCCQQQQQTTTTAKEQTQLIPSSYHPAEAAAPDGIPSYSTQHLAADEAAVNLDAVTNAAVKAIIENAYATAATANAGAEPAAAAAATPKHSDGIRMHKHRQSHQAHNSWQCVNLKNPTGCQLKKQICGDGYECSCRISSNYDNRSNYAQIHDCQKCRANSINPFARLCSDKMHEVGADKSASASASASAYDDDNNNGGDRDDVWAGGGGGGGDGPIRCDKGCRAAAILGISTCHTGQQKQVGKLHRRRRSGQIPFQTDLEEFKEFLDQITSTPRLK